MKTIFALLFLLFPLSIFAQKGTITGNVVGDLRKLLPAGERTIEVMDSTVASARRIELADKFTAATRANPEWFLEYEQTHNPDTDSLVYDPHFGLTKAEFEEMRHFLSDHSDMYTVPSGTEQISIMQAGNLIGFAGEGKAAILQRVIINLADTIVTINSHQCRLGEGVAISDTNNGLHSAWHGYTWEYAEGLSDSTTMRDLVTTDIRYYRFTIGTVDKTGKTYVQVVGKEILQGTTTVEFDRSFLF